MKLEIKNFKGNLINFLRQTGYIFQRKENDEQSFIRSLAKGVYPRFHIYAAQKENFLVLKIHLDQKGKTYGKGRRHHGEYENEGALKNEVERLKQFFA